MQAMKRQFTGTGIETVAMFFIYKLSV